MFTRALITCLSIRRLWLLARMLVMSMWRCLPLSLLRLCIRGWGMWRWRILTWRILMKRWISHVRKGIPVSWRSTPHYPGVVTWNSSTTLLTHSKSSGWTNPWPSPLRLTPNSSTCKSAPGTHSIPPFSTLKALQSLSTTTYTRWEKTRLTPCNTVFPAVGITRRKALEILCVGSTLWNSTKSLLRS